MTSTPSAARATALGRSLVLLVALAVLGAVGLVVTTSPPARAAGLTQVTGFGSNPGALAMYSYRPDGLPSGAPLVVELHGCTQNASTYFANSGWREMADRHGVRPRARAAEQQQQLELLLQLVPGVRHGARAG
ncbi:hypothetical protein [Phycicoccus jejuensis]|uniref:hypothetical protein n=1 Tax=Phycicoccus jejuensis TaxID=367299 RepID=UPI000A58BC33|nr:hypothetical protein [Phycicoccus jejuensis]